MSLSETELIYLMAYVDGQVDDDELPEVTALLARSEEARQIVAQHGALGDWIRESNDARAAAAGADRIAAQVLSEIDKLGGGKVIEIERDRAKVAKNRQRVKEFGALFAIAAIAAAFLLMPTTPTTPVAMAPSAKAPTKATPRPVESAVVAAVAPSGSAEAPIAASTAGTEQEDDPGMDVQSVDSPDHPFSIFYVPAATGLNAHSSSVVVWITE
jgi:negative regulator of sigma E activity